MKSLLCLSLMLSSGVVVLGQGQSAKQPFVITISPVSQTLRVGSEVTITVHLKNTSSKELDLSANISDLTNTDPNYTYEVHDGNGRLVARKAYAHPELANGRAVFQTVKPGESVSDKEPISRLLEMRKPGRYVVQISRPISNDEKDGIVKSNKIVVTVTP
jgi:hypothetical protein